ncbi:MAG: VacB/RNase II family 3'-5' exoribonuclease, partial [Oscillospiraceae bacterium]
MSLFWQRKASHEQFDEEIILEAEGVISRIDMANEKIHRTDLTHLPIFTIDSASTKDIDDAICVLKTDSGYNLGVHIADVSHYVRPTSLCNKEAFERGNSIYYGDSVIPMLPQEYSNDVCSLNENTEKLAFTCDIQLDDKGDVIDYKFYKSIIRSRVKGVYSEINTILAGEETQEIKDKYKDVLSEIFAAQELYNLLKTKRDKRGSMDIESDEAYIIFDETGHAQDIKKRERGMSEMIIEECMLLANSCSANLAKKADLPFVYRVHEEPAAEKLLVLKNNLRRFGLTLEPKEGESLQQSMSALLDKTRDTNLQLVIHKGILRSQSKAKYSENPIGHFGLALEDYAHFTSPIRRYSDLAIHRILTDYVNGAAKEKMHAKFDKFVTSASQQTSQTEIVAMQVERGATDIYKAEIMEKHIGEEFEGVVTSVISFGIYITLENTVEGLAHISTLNMVSPILTEGYSL